MEEDAQGRGLRDPGSVAFIQPQGAHRKFPFLQVMHGFCRKTSTSTPQKTRPAKPHRPLVRPRPHATRYLTPLYPLSPQLRHRTVCPPPRDTRGSQGAPTKGARTALGPHLRLRFGPGGGFGVNVQGNTPAETALLRLTSVGQREDFWAAHQRTALEPRGRHWSPEDETRGPSESATTPRVGCPGPADDGHLEHEATTWAHNSPLCGETGPTWDWVGQQPSRCLPCLLQGLLLLPLSPAVPNNPAEHDTCRTKRHCQGPLTTLGST